MNWYGGDSYPERNPKTVYGVGLPKPKPMGGVADAANRYDPPLHTQMSVDGATQWMRLFPCSRCGALVGDRDRHNQWHHALEAARRALRDVLEIHTRIEDAPDLVYCEECCRLDGMELVYAEWPCPTVQAIRAKAWADA